MPSPYIVMPIAATDAARAGIPLADGASGRELRIVVRLEPLGDGTPAVSYYVEALLGDRGWAIVSNCANNRDESIAQLRAIERLAQQVDIGMAAWVVAHGAARPGWGVTAKNLSTTPRISLTNAGAYGKMKT